MKQYIEIIRKKMDDDDLFIKSSENEIKKISEILGTSVKDISEFYKEYHPHNIPEFDCNFSFLSIDEIDDEIQSNEPSCNLKQFGLVTIGITFGGNVICVDTNNIYNEGSKIYLADSSICFYDSNKNKIVVGNFPDRFMERFDMTKEIEFNYDNIIKCMPLLANSFEEFLRKLALDEYDDLEDLLF